MDNKAIKNILEELAKHIPKKQVSSLENGFNIFNVLGIQDKEVIICRLLGELLNPIGTHDMNSAPLKLFLVKVLKVDDETDESINNADVVLEEHIQCPNDSSDSNRRVDIVIHTAIRDYPIEVKLWADDQPRQLSDYYHYYYSRNPKNEHIYYLTPDRHEPSNDSRQDLELGKQIIILSFDDEIDDWLCCLSNHTKNTFISTVIKQFREIIKNMSESEKNINEIKKLISFDRQNENASDIVNILAFLCQKKNAAAVMSDIKMKYLTEYISAGDQYTLNDASNNPLEVYKNDAALLVNNVSEKKFNVWVCLENEEKLYLLAESNCNIDGWHNDSRYSWKYVKNNNRNVYIKEFASLTGRINIKNDLDNVLKAINNAVKQ